MDIPFWLVNLGNKETDSSKARRLELTSGFYGVQLSLPFGYRTTRLSTNRSRTMSELRGKNTYNKNNHSFCKFGLFRVEMHSLLSRPGSDNSISLWCKLRHTIDLSYHRSWFPFGDYCFIWHMFLFFETCTQPFCKRHYPVIVITITRQVLYTGKCTRLYILEIIKAWP